MRLAAALVGAIACGVALTASAPARACGACFHPPPDVSTDPTVVSEHHMVFSISKTQTVLWDQIKYSGNPKEFAWVLPVRAGTRIELSHDAFIKALDAYTAPIVEPPITPQQNDSVFAFSCGSSDAEYSTLAPSAGGGATQVISDQVVGPYEAVTLQASSGASLNAWLDSHGYQVPTGFQPTIDAYVKEQFDFIALRLLPGRGISSMQPVRVVTQGADASLPLRMVAAGVGAQVGVVLYVIGEGRYHTENFRDVAIDDGALTWDDKTSSSNYATLAESLMTGGDGKGVLTEYAGHAAQNDFAPQGYYYYGSYFLSLAAAYSQASSYAVSQDAKCTSLGDAGAADAGAADAGAIGGGECVFDDLDVATSGMAQADVWVTRLRMNLPAQALGEGDLRLAASSPQALQTNVHQVPYVDKSGGCSTSESRARSAWPSLVFAALGLTWLLRRRRA